MMLLSEMLSLHRWTSAGFGLYFFNHHTYLLLTQQRHHSTLPSELPLGTGNHFFTLSPSPSVPASTIHIPLSHCFLSESTPSLPTTLPPVNYSPFDLPISSCFISHHTPISVIQWHPATSPATSSPTWVADAIHDDYSLSCFSCHLPLYSAPFPSKHYVYFVILQHPFLFLEEFSSINPLHKSTFSISTRLHEPYLQLLLFLCWLSLQPL